MIYRTLIKRMKVLGGEKIRLLEMDFDCEAGSGIYQYTLDTPVPTDIVTYTIQGYTERLENHSHKGFVYKDIISNSHFVTLPRGVSIIVLTPHSSVLMPDCINSIYKLDDIVTDKLNQFKRIKELINVDGNVDPDT